MSAVLSSTCLTAYWNIAICKSLTCTTQYGISHTPYYIVVRPTVGFSIVLTFESGVDRSICNTLHHMWHHIISAIGNSSTKVCYLQRRKVHLTLSDRDTDDGKTIP